MGSTHQDADHMNQLYTCMVPKRCYVLDKGCEETDDIFTHSVVTVDILSIGRSLGKVQCQEVHFGVTFWCNI